MVITGYGNKILIVKNNIISNREYLTEICIDIKDYENTRKIYLYYLYQ